MPGMHGMMKKKRGMSKAKMSPMKKRGGGMKGNRKTTRIPMDRY